MYVVFLGAPGAGKGTQAGVLGEKMGVLHLATGDVLRAAVKQETPLGLEAKGYMERGELVPDSLVVNLVVDRVAEGDAANGAILDGFPRNLSQARALDEALKRRGAKVDLVLYLKVREEALVARLAGRWECGTCRTPYHEQTKPPKAAGVCDQCGGALTQRPDDVPETVRRRLQVYFEQTAPLLDYYRAQDVLREINGERPIAEVTAQIQSVVASVEGKSRGA
ncbi:MAG TPA: adenylate kinase [Chloroflexota bacterium]|nr:adenylate kinase [Chloroflexota bacterium]